MLHHSTATLGSGPYNVTSGISKKEKDEMLRAKVSSGELPDGLGMYPRLGLLNIIKIQNEIIKGRIKG